MPSKKKKQTAAQHERRALRKQQKKAKKRDTKAKGKKAALPRGMAASRVALERELEAEDHDRRTGSLFATGATAEFRDGKFISHTPSHAAADEQSDVDDYVASTYLPSSSGSSGEGGAASSSSSVRGLVADEDPLNRHQSEVRADGWSTRLPSLRPDRNLLQKMADAAELLQTMVVASPDFGLDYFLKPQGSAAQGLTLSRTSDLDLVLCHSDALVASKKEQVRWLRDLASCLRSSAARSEGFRVKEVIFSAKIPLLKLLFQPGSAGQGARTTAGAWLSRALEIDLSAGDARRGLPDEAIRRILAQGRPLCRAFVRLIKIYANGYELNDTRQRGCSNLAWTLLAVFFLQRKNELAALRGSHDEIKESCGTEEIPELEGTDHHGGSGVFEGNSVLVEEEQRLALWFEEFLKFCDTGLFEVMQRGLRIDVCVAKLVSKVGGTDIPTISRSARRSSFTAAPLQIQVPLAAEGENAARCLSAEVWDTLIRPTIQRSRVVLQYVKELGGADGGMEPMRDGMRRIFSERALEVEMARATDVGVVPVGGGAGSAAASEPTTSNYSRSVARAAEPSKSPRSGGGGGGDSPGAGRGGMGNFWKGLDGGDETDSEGDENARAPVGAMEEEDVQQPSKRKRHSAVVSELVKSDERLLAVRALLSAGGEGGGEGQARKRGGKNKKRKAQQNKGKGGAGGAPVKGGQPFQPWKNVRKDH